MSANFSEPFWVEVFAAGDHTDSAGQRQRFSEQDLDMMISAFNATRNDATVPIRLNLVGDPHSEFQAIAVGWIGDLRRDGNKLLALFTDVPTNVVETFRKKLFRKVSVGLRFNRELGGKLWARFLDHVAVLGAHNPAVKTLADLDAYLASEAEKLGEIGEGVQVFEYADLSLSDTKEEPPMADSNDKALEILSKQVAELTANFTELKGENEKLKAERDAATKRAETAESADAKRKADFTQAERTRTFADCKAKIEDQVKAKKLTPAMSAALLKGLGESSNFSETNELLIPWSNVVAFSELVAAGPGSESGAHEHGTDEPADKRVVDKVQELLAKQPTMTFSDATRAVLLNDPALAKDYAEYAREVQ